MAERQVLVRIARGWPSLIAGFLLVAGIAILAIPPVDGGMPRLAIAGKVSAALMLLYLAFAAFRVLLAGGALIYVAKGRLVQTLATTRGLKLEDIRSATLKESQVFEGRRDEIVLHLASGRTAKVSALLSRDAPEVVLRGLDELLPAKASSAPAPSRAPRR